MSLIVNFSSDRVQGEPPFSVKFTDLTQGDPDAWFWDFGDKTSSTERNPRHVYYHPGFYTVRLIVYKNGFPFTTSKSRYISVSPIDAGVATPDVAVSVEQIQARTAYAKGKGNFVFMRKGVRIEKIND